MKELFDKEGNLVDGDGKILKTKEELETKKTEAEKEKAKIEAEKAKKTKELNAKLESITVKNNDDVFAAVAKMAEVMKDTALSNAERVEASKKMEVVLAAHIKKSDTFQEITEAQLGEISEQQEADDKSVFDIAMKAPIFTQWGYGNPKTPGVVPIERALYKPHTKYVTGKGWVHDGKGYELDDIVYQLNDMLYLTGMNNAINSQVTSGGEIQTYAQAAQKLETLKLFNFELDRRPELRKALSTIGEGTGAEYIPTGMSSQLIDDLRLELKVAALFPTITMPARSGSFDLPFRGSRRTAFLQGESVDDSSSKYPADTIGTGKITFTPVKHALRMLFSDEFDEDSAIAAMPLLLQELRFAIAGAHENAILNGDTDSTHMDSDVTSSTDVRKSWLGIRRHSGNSGGSAAVDISVLSTSLLRSIEKAMGRFGVNPGKRAWVTGISGYIQMLSLTEVLTMDKFGPDFTVKSGQLGQFDGSPIIVSEYMRQDLNLSGVYDGATTTDTEILLVHTPAFYTGEKPSGIKVETDRNIETGQNIAVASRRLDFKQVITPGTDEETVGVGYSLTS